MISHVVIAPYGHFQQDGYAILLVTSIEVRQFPDSIQYHGDCFVALLLAMTEYKKILAMTFFIIS